MSKVGRRLARQKRYHQKRWKFMRRLTFSPDEKGQLKFSVLYQGFILGVGQEDAGIAAARTADKVYDKLEAISEPLMERRNGAVIPVVLNERSKEPMRSLLVEEGQIHVELEDTEADLVKRRLANAAWTGREAKAFLAMHDELEKPFLQAMVDERHREPSTAESSKGSSAA